MIDFLHRPPSETYLFDRQRTGRTLYDLRSLSEPVKKWSFKLKSFPAYAPESSAAFDQSGNLYFGAHDGCFYSLTPEGKLRWMFRTSRKIYSSPILSKDRIVFHCGDGRLYCLTIAEGNLLWVTNAAEAIPYGKWTRKLLTFYNLFKYDYSWAQRLGMKTWSSPLLSDDSQVVYSVCRGVGLLAVDIASGKRLWNQPLGSPWNYLGGPSLGLAGEILACGQRKEVFCFQPDGKLRWKCDTGVNLDFWCSPAVDLEHGRLFVTAGLGSNEGAVISLNLDGKVNWVSKAPGALRGGVALGRSGELAMACLNGKVAVMSGDTGEIKFVAQTSGEAGWLNWTTPSVTPGNHILVPTVDGPNAGTIRCYDMALNLKWSIPIGKSHAVPVIDAEGCFYASSWRGELCCFQS